MCLYLRTKFQVSSMILTSFSFRGLCKISSVLVCIFNPLNANPKKWSNTLKQIFDKLPTICLSVFDHFMNLALKGLIGDLKWKIF